MMSTPAFFSGLSGGASEDELVHPDGIQRPSRSRRPVAGRFDIHHLEVVAGRVLDQHRFKGAKEIGLLLQIVSVVHAPDHLADPAAEVTCDTMNTPCTIGVELTEKPPRGILQAAARLLVPGRACGQRQKSASETGRICQT
jgi:hypothetical protein